MPAPSRTKEMIVRIPVELHEQLKQRAEADDRTVAATVRVALREYLATGRGTNEGGAE